jgi:hypothetical protein
VQLHRKHAAEGLVVMSVDLMRSELESKGKVLDFLRGQGADFPNFILDDAAAKVDAWQERHKIEVTPAVLLYSRSGEPVPVPQGATPDEVEAVVRRLLAEK